MKNISKYTITTDVLVIGAGFAGCFAAIRARELGAEVLMVEAGKSGFSGASAIGTHNTRVLLPEDDLDAAIKSCVVDSDYMVDQEYAEGATAEAYDRFQELMKYGIDFERDFNGDVYWVIEQTVNPFYKQRIATFADFGSYKNIHRIKKGVLHLGVKVLDRTMVIDLLTSDGNVVGAVGIDSRKGDFYVFKAKAVVMATGNSVVLAEGVEGPPASYTGDGIAMALRSGAQLRAMEFGKLELASASKYFFEGGYLGKAMSYDYFEGGRVNFRIVNANGEEFLEQYELLRRSPTRMYNGPPWKNFIPAFFKELREGRGPCYLEWKRPDKTYRFEYGIGGHFLSQLGGIRIDPHGVSSVPGLLAGGIASDMCCAPHFSVPANSLGSHITGRRAGESAAEYAKGQSEPAVDQKQVDRLKAEAYAPLDRDKGTTEKEIRIKMIEAWPNLDLRNEENLNKAFNDFQDCEQEAASLKADDYHELVKCHKVRNLLQVAQATAIAARERRETRLEHFREDYPLVDNIDWLKWVIVRGTGEHMETLLEDIPIEKWKYKPERKLVDRLELTRLLKASKGKESVCSDL